MQAISPKLGEFLIKVTRSKDIDDAFRRVFSDYLKLKIASFMEPIEGFRKKWGMEFDEFQKRFRDGTLKKDTYAFETEQDFWGWEEAETLKNTMQHWQNNGHKSIFTLPVKRSSNP